MSRDLGEVVTTLSSELTTFTWRIKNFSEIMRMDLYPSTEFDAGESIGLPSKWELSLIPPGGSETVELQLKLLKHLKLKGNMEERNNFRKESFNCVATLKMGDDPQDFTTINLDWTSLNDDLEAFEQRIGKFEALKKSALINDELVIHLKFTLRDPKSSNLSSGWEEASSANKMMAQAREEALANFGSLLESGDNSDFVIKVKRCDDGNVVEIKVHKGILGSRSQVFQRMFELEMTERSTGTMLIEDLSPACVKMMLKWMYTGVLDEDWKNIPEELVHATNKYGLTLLNFLDQNLHFVCNFENAENLREAAKLHGLETATKNIINFITANIGAFYERNKM